MQAEIFQMLDLKIVISSFSNSRELTQKVLGQNQGEYILFLHGDKLHNEISSAFADSGLYYSEFEVYKNTPIEKFVSGIFDAYLFFSPLSIDNFKASGNFP